MISMQTIVGTSATAFIFAGAFSLLGIATDGPTYIEVHSIEYDTQDGFPHITQNRTVAVDGPVLVAKWEAKAYLINGTQLLEVCSGGDGADYTAGFKAHRMGFDYWVGDPGCFDRIPNGSKVKLYAKHTWGVGEFSEKWSGRFIVDKSFLFRPVQ